MNRFLGAHIQGYPSDLSRLDAWKQKVGRYPAIVGHYQTMDGPYPDFYMKGMQYAADLGVTTMVSWDADSQAILDRIAAGLMDDYFHHWAADAKVFGKTVLLRPLYEMNGKWANWYPVDGGQSYIDAFRRIVTNMRLFADNIRFVWCPNVGGALPYSAIYPGDEFVDYAALDGYNWGGGDWESLSAVFRTSMDQLRQVTQKPVVIAETATPEGEVPDDKASWIKNGLESAIPRRFPYVVGLLWFDWNKEVDWRTDSSATSLRQFKSTASKSSWKGKVA